MDTASSPQPRRVQGFWDIGPITIPPRPRQFALSDRSDGKTYEIIKSGSDPVLSEITAFSAHTVLGTFDGPYVQDGSRARRLFASGGTLSSEAVDFKASLGPVLITVATAPLDVWEVLWDSATRALTLTERR